MTVTKARSIRIRTNRLMRCAKVIKTADVKAE